MSLKRLKLGRAKDRALVLGDEQGEPPASGSGAEGASTEEGTPAADSDPTTMSEPELLVPARARCQADITSKKRALELLSELIAADHEEITPRDVLNCLVSREKLGSTGLGHGVAIPHGRLPQVKSALGAALTLQSGVDFDAPDNEPVDLVVGLIVPEESTDEHLHILANLAQAFSDAESVRAVREATTPEELSRLLSGFLAKR